MTHRFSLHSMYYKIACQQEGHYWKYAQRLDEAPEIILGADDVVAEIDAAEDAYEKREKAAVIAITFSAMSMESFLFDFAATILGDSYAEGNLDKLDIKSKFLIFQKLVCGTGPDKGGQAYQGLSTLQATRNDLVHFKSKSFDRMDADSIANYHSRLDEKMRKGVENSTSAVRLALRELDGLHGANSCFVREMENCVGR